MALSIHTMHHCCWDYMKGVNNQTFNEKAFKLMLLKKYNNALGYTDWICPTKFTGAIIFCGAHGGMAHALAGPALGTINKQKVLANLEKICQFIEDEEMGDVVELPSFTNGLHSSGIEPRMWIIDQIKFQVALKRWYAETLVQFKAQAGAQWVL